ncbi:hypothetical protein CW304_24110 [Bacillus sp. UFRGS-B20]|nr:hypothetical protein CW304_24110 [Bacillus sp. UFRGS-B20]
MARYNPKYERSYVCQSVKGKLESRGHCSSNVYPRIPVRIEYGLTDKGKAYDQVMDEVKLG